MVGRGLSNKARHERLLLGTQGDAVAAVPFIVRAIYNSRKTEWTQMEVSEVASSGTGTIHGIIIGQVSPIKSSKKQSDVKCFKGQIRNGVKTMRLNLRQSLHGK